MVMTLRGAHGMHVYSSAILKDCEAMLRTVDANGDGQIDYGEYLVRVNTLTSSKSRTS